MTNHMPDLDDLDEVGEDDIRSLRTSLTVYRCFAYLTGILLVLLVCVAVPLKYFGDDDRLVTWTGLPHGWLYMGLLISAYVVGRKVGWHWQRLLLIALAGTVPFLSFVAEHSARRSALAKIAEWEQQIAAGKGRSIN